MTKRQARFLAISVMAVSCGSCLDRRDGDVFSQLHFNGETMSDYYTLGAKRAGLLVYSKTGLRLSQWATTPVAPGRTDFTWGDPRHWPSQPGKPIHVEEWSIKSNCAGGKTFVWMDAYRNDYVRSSLQHRYKVETTRAEFRVGEGPWVDITAGGACGTMGQPYALHDVTTDPYSLRVWGNIYTADGQSVGRRFFWQHTISYVPDARNSCWKADAEKTRPAIKQEEAWWDSFNGWTLGTGAASQNGEPDGSQVAYARWQMVGKGVGGGWGGQTQARTESEFCMQYQWNW